jgi:type I restriction enzyme R subunit
MARSFATVRSAWRSICEPWRDGGDGQQSLSEVEKAATSMLLPAMVLDMLDSFTAFATQKGKYRVKIIARCRQVDGVSKIVARV